MEQEWAAYSFNYPLVIRLLHFSTNWWYLLDILFSYHFFPSLLNTFSISWKVWTCLNFSINWSQFSICWKFLVITLYNLMISRNRNQLNGQCNVDFIVNSFWRKSIKMRFATSLWKMLTPVSIILLFWNKVWFIG